MAINQKQYDDTTHSITSNESATDSCDHPQPNLTRARLLEKFVMERIMIEKKQKKLLKEAKEFSVDIETASHSANKNEIPNISELNLTENKILKVVSDDEIQLALFQFAKNNDIEGVTKYIKDHKSEIAKIIDTYGCANKYIDQAHKFAYDNCNFHFACAYELAMEEIDDNAFSVD
ncbi:uncharacterized protein LOC124806527 isoform X2 [Hydra vulgaris]|uniref:uncharacterized protein LOC124806527 isoform X2 n=1 Tax=Hydra vulgaris TaxID=6087 RepID=UPI0032EA4CCD